MKNVDIQLSKVSLELDEKNLFQIDRLKVLSGDRIGIIGNNGVGKSSLLNLIAGELKPTSGLITVYPSFAYLKQMNDFSDLTNYDVDYQLFSHFDMGESIHSGGEQQKLRLIETLSEHSSLLLLDEPTNHLDNHGINFLLNWLNNYRGTVVIISHNRQILNQICDKIWLIENQTVKEYDGNYQAFIKQREIEKLTNTREVDFYEKTKAHLKQVIDNKKRQIEHTTVTDDKKERRINPGRIAASKDKKTVQKNMEKGIKSVENKLKNLQRVEKIAKDREIIFPDTNFATLHSKFPIMADKLTIKRDEKVLLDKVSFQLPNRRKIALIGANGSGKTSLIEAIIDGHEGLLVSQKVRISSFKQLSYNSNKDDIILNFLSKDSDYPLAVLVGILNNLGFEDNDLRKPIRQLSGGQRTRLSLAKVFSDQSNILLLDEPTNFIDLQTTEALEKLIISYPGMVIFTSHDNDFVSKVADIFLEIRDKKIVCYDNARDLKID